VKPTTLLASLALCASAAASPSTRLDKDALRPRMHAMTGALATCYEDARAREPSISGVINTKLTVTNEPDVGLTVRVRGFATSGALGESRAFLDCATAALEALVLRPLAARGSLDLTYPMTFAPQPPDNKQRAIVDKAARAAKQGRAQQALELAERGLELTSLDGTFRRRLIEIAGRAACQLEQQPKARHYFAMASSRVEKRLQQACSQVSIDLAQ
jgi:hypothetical protein